MKQEIRTPQAERNNVAHVNSKVRWLSGILAALREEEGEVFELGPVPTSCPAGMAFPWETGRYFFVEA